MDIDIESFINAIADKLRLLFPNYKVYDDKAKQNSFENCFYITAHRISVSQRLKNRWRRDYDLDIAFFPAENNASEFYIWEETMLTDFQRLKVGDSLHMLKDIDLSKVDDIWHFTFAVSFFIVEKENLDKMETLDIREGLL